MKHLLFILTVHFGFVTYSQDTLLSTIDAAEFPPPQTIAKKDTMLSSLYKKIEALENSLKKRETDLIANLVDTLSKLPLVLNQIQLDEIQNNKKEIDDLKNQLNAANTAKQAAQSTLTTKESALKTAEQKVSDNEKAYTKSWEDLCKTLLSTEKHLSNDVYKLIVKNIKQQSIKSELDSFVMYSSILLNASAFLNQGTGDFNKIYPSLKLMVLNKNFTQQIKMQQELLNMFQLFIFFAQTLDDKLDVIKADQDKNSRKIELENWKHYKTASVFPFLKKKIEENFNSHKPLNLVYLP